MRASPVTSPTTFRSRRGEKSARAATSSSETAVTFWSGGRREMTTAAYRRVSKRGQSLASSARTS